MKQAPSTSTRAIACQRIVLSLLALASVGLAACAKPSESMNISPNDAGLLHGTPPPHGSFLWESAATLDMREDGFCSAVLIGPQTLLTAGHCVNWGEGPKVPLRAHFLGVDGHETAVIAVTNAVLPSEYSFTFLTKVGLQLVNASDLAILSLASPAPASSKPIRFETSLSAFTVGSWLTVAGSGMTQPAPVSRDLQFTYEKMQVLQQGNGALKLKNATTTVCGGDSGSGAFFMRNGLPSLVGLASLGDSDCQLAGNISTYTQVANFATWITNGTNRLHDLAVAKRVGQVLLLPTHE